MSWFLNLEFLRSIQAKLVALILAACIIPSILIIGMNSNRLQEIREIARSSASKTEIDHTAKTMRKISGQQAEIVSLRMASLADEATSLAQATEMIYRRPGTWTPSFPRLRIIKDPAGEYYGDIASTSGDLFISGRNSLTPSLLKEVDSLNELQPMMISISKLHREAVYVYVVTKDSVVRGYPAPMPTPEVVAAGILDPLSDFREAPFYYVADSSHNPKRKAKWTDIYFDPGGNGWMFSVCAPVYAGDELRAVAALDITTDQIIGNLLDKNITPNSYSLIANHSGAIISYPDNARSDIGWKKNTEPDSINLLKSPDSRFKAMFAEAVKSGSCFKRVSFDDTAKYIYIEKIKNTPFLIVTAVPEHELLAQIREMDQRIGRSALSLSKETLWSSLLVLIIATLIAFFYAKRISKPIVELTEKAFRISQGDLDQKIEVHGHDEISALAKDFNEMTEALRTRTQEQAELMGRLSEQNLSLERKNNQLTHLINRLTEAEEIGQHYQTMSYTDDLTGIFNRRYFDEHFRGEFNGQRKRNTVYACLLFDIDGFKAVNDTYGHLAGDAALRLVAEILLQNKRFYDVAARFAGDEFVILMENSGLSEARDVAERIRSAVESASLVFKEQEILLTVSIGIAVINPQIVMTGEEILHEADMALYQAKDAGGNRIALASEMKDFASST